MRIEKALEQISEIHEHLAKSQMFRGYRAVPAALSGVLAIAAAWIQPLLISDNGAFLYVAYWTIVAVLALLIAGGSVIYAYIRETDPHARQRTVTVVGQMTPSLTVGVILTTAFLLMLENRLVCFLPAVWALLYGLGISASKPFLPRMMGWVSVFYILCGCILLLFALADAPHKPSPWETGIPFGAGQVFFGMVLYWNLERKSRDLK